MKTLRAVTILLAVCVCALAQTTTVTGTFTDLAGDPVSGNCVLQPAGPFSATGGWRVISAPVNVAFTNGAFSVALAPTDSATPGGQYYKVSCAIPAQTISGRVVGPYSYGPRIWLVPTSATSLDISVVESNLNPGPPPVTILPSQISTVGASVGEALCFNGISYAPGSCAGGGSGGPAMWGAITGTLSTQADLAAALAAKQATIANAPATWPTSWAWSSLSGVPATWAWSALSGVPATFPPPQPTSTTLGGVEAKDCSSVGAVQKINTDGTISCVATGGSATWGAITGTLSSQTDLTAALATKQNSITNAPGTWPTFATVATSGSYSDLSNKPTIPTTTSQLSEGSNLYFTNSRVLAAIAGLYEPPLGNPPVSGYVLSSTTSGSRSWVPNGTGGGSSLFTSFQFGSQTALTGSNIYVQMTFPSLFTLTQTGSGTSGSPFVAALGLASQSQNCVFASPNGSSGAPTCRGIVAQDLPTIPYAQLSGVQASLGFTPENAANKGIASGYAGLDSGSKVPLGNLPTIPYSQTSGVQASLGYTAENTANKGAASGYAGLDSESKIPIANLPTIPYSQTSGVQASLGYTAENTANKGAANGYAGLDSGSKVPLANLPTVPYSQTSGVQASLGYTAENTANKGAASGYAPLDGTSKVPLTNLPTIPYSQTSGITPAAIGAAGLAASNTFTTGTQDFHGAQHTLPAVSGLAANKPATCTVGEEYFATDVTPGQNMYYCTAANTWSQQITAGTIGNSGGYTGPNAVYSSGTTYYLPPAGSLLADTTETNVQGLQTVTGAISNFGVKVYPSPGSATLTFTWRDNAVSQSVTCSITNTNTKCSDYTHTFNVAVNDLIDIQMTVAGANWTGTVIAIWATPGVTGQTGSAGAGNNAYCAPASGSGTTYTCPSPTPSVSTLSGLLVAMVPDVTNTGAATLNVASLGAKTLKQSDCSTDLNASALTAHTMYTFQYNGSVFCQAGGSSGAGGGLSVLGNTYITDGTNYYGTMLNFSPPPAATSFTAYNAGNCTFTGGGTSPLYFSHTANGSNDTCVEYIAAPATPYSITIAISPGLLSCQSFQCSGTNAMAIGLALWDSASDKTIACADSMGFTSAGVNAIYAVGFTHAASIASGTTLSSIPALPVLGTYPLILKVRDDGSNVSCSFSLDAGKTLVSSYSASRTAFTTNAPNRVGLWIGNANSSFPTSGMIIGWTQGN